MAALSGWRCFAETKSRPLSSMFVYSAVYTWRWHSFFNSQWLVAIVALAGGKQTKLGQVCSRSRGARGAGNTNVSELQPRSSEADTHAGLPPEQFEAEKVGWTSLLLI